MLSSPLHFSWNLQLPWHLHGRKLLNQSLLALLLTQWLEELEHWSIFKLEMLQSSFLTAGSQQDHVFLPLACMICRCLESGQSRIYPRNSRQQTSLGTRSLSEDFSRPKSPLEDGKPTLSFTFRQIWLIVHALGSKPSRIWSAALGVKCIKFFFFQDHPYHLI